MVREPITTVVADVRPGTKMCEGKLLYLQNQQGDLYTLRLGLLGP
jgi:hypothetical protein